MDQTKQDNNKHDEKSPKKLKPKNEEKKVKTNEFKIRFTYPTSKNFYKDQPLCKMDLM